LETVNINSGPHKGETTEIHDNTIHILVSKNGSGKSQLLRALKNQWKDADSAIPEVEDARKRLAGLK